MHVIQSKKPERQNMMTGSGLFNMSLQGRKTQKGEREVPDTRQFAKDFANFYGLDGQVDSKTYDTAKQVKDSMRSSSKHDSGVKSQSASQSARQSAR